MVKDCVRTLLSYANDEFAGASHVLSFPRAQGFTGPRERHRGDVFSRAIIAEALAHAAAADRRAHAIVERELAYLRSVRRADGSGWAYFPELTELPSDADDLAAVVRALVRANGVLHASQCAREPLRRWLQLVRRDGTAPTWIPSDDPAVRAVQERWTRTVWGDTYDVEVAANMVVAMDVLGAGGPIIDALRRAIAERQEGGAWRSTWYWGPYYGTMICTLALCSDARFKSALTGARRFLLETMDAEGGWGRDGASNALDTSFALLALCAAACLERTPSIGSAACLGLNALARLCGDVERQAVPFIRMDLGRAQWSTRETLSYGSAAITAAFTLKAALAWESINVPGEQTA